MAINMESNNQIETKPDEKATPENSARLLKLEMFSDSDKEDLLDNPKAFPFLGTGVLSIVPDMIDSFRLEEKDKIKLLFGDDIGDKKSQLRYGLNKAGNVERFRYGFDGNMVLLGQVQENDIHFKYRPYATNYNKNAIRIGHRFKMGNKRFEIYTTQPDGTVSFHDLKTGMDDHYRMNSSIFKDQGIYRTIEPLGKLKTLIQVGNKDRQILHKQEYHGIDKNQKTLANKKTTTMNDNEQGQERPKRTNEEFLKDNLKYLGFGDGLYQALEQNLAAKQPSFSLDTTMLHGEKQMDFKLNFKQGRDGDRYFFNNYEATLSHNNANGTPVQKKQTFYIDKGRAFTAKESFNMLDGRAVFRDDLSTKDNKTYKAWVKLDLEHPLPNGQHKPLSFGEDHGKKIFDLGTELMKFDIRGLDNPTQADWIINGLERGNLQQVNMVRGETKVNDPSDASNKERVTFIAAEPRYKSINVYDENSTKIFVANNMPLKQENASTNVKTENPVQQQSTAVPIKQAAPAKKEEAPRAEKRKGHKM